jgi:hypothetical protein
MSHTIHRAMLYVGFICSLYVVCCHARGRGPLYASNSIQINKWIEPISGEIIDTIERSQTDHTFFYHVIQKYMKKLYDINWQQAWEEWPPLLRIILSGTPANMKKGAYIYNAIPYIERSLYTYRTLSDGNEISVGPHIFQYDSIIVASNKRDIECGLSRTDDFVYCSFNELFICTALGDPRLLGVKRVWYGFDYGKQASWHRDPKLYQFNVRDWRYIRTRNRNIWIKVRFGKRDSNCQKCIDTEGCDADDDFFWPKENGVFVEKEYNEYFRGWYEKQAISCIAIMYSAHHTTGNSPPSCDYSTQGYYLNSMGFMNTVSTGTWPRTPLPATATKVYDMTNAIVVAKDVDHAIDISDSISSCKPGFVKSINFDDFHFTVYNYRTIGCLTFAATQCNPRPGPDQSIVSCKDSHIHYRCRSFFGDDEAHEICITREIDYCKNFNVRSATVTVAGVSFENQCGKVNCRGNYYFDLENWALTLDPTSPCTKCPEQQDNSIQKPDERCEGAYRGTFKCMDFFFKTAVQASDPICEACARCSLGQFQAVRCSSSMQLVGGTSPELQYTGRNTVCMDCTNICPRGYFRNCIEIPPANPTRPPHEALCTPCNCGEKSEAARQSVVFCLINDDICNGRTNMTAGGNWTYYSQQRCPVGMYKDTSSYITDPMASYGAVHSMDLVYEKICKQCTPILNCSIGFMWPGCPIEDEIRIQNPVCVPCDESQHPTQSDVFEFKRTDLDPKVYPDCSWRCNAGYYQNVDTYECIECVYTEMPSCPRGAFRGACKIGTINLPACEECVSEKKTGITQEEKVCSWNANDGYTQSNEFRLKCSGEGYVDHSGYSEGTLNICTQCKIRDDCDGLGTDDKPFGWSPCGKTTVALLNDPGSCAECMINFANSYVLPPANNPGQCISACKESFYMNSRKTSCNPCEDIATHCRCGNDCNDGHRIENCTRGMDKEPECFCKAGYERSTAQDATKCTACVNYYYRTEDTPNSKCEQCPVGYMGNLETASTTCIPCPANTYRMLQGVQGSQFQFKCLICDAGTEAIIGSGSCTTCTRGSGERASVLTWRGLVWNHVVGDFVRWEGIPPTVCDVKGTNETMQICKPPGNFKSISWKPIGHLGPAYDFDYLPTPEWSCELCANGLAFSSNFDWNSAFELYN